MKNKDYRMIPAVTIGFFNTAITPKDLNYWPEHSRNAAKEMIDKYGRPDVMGSEVLVWHNGNEPLVIDKHHGIMGQMELV